jgi:hypothetical protein
MYLRVEVEPHFMDQGRPFLRFTIKGGPRNEDIRWDTPLDAREWESLVDVLFDRAKRLMVMKMKEMDL